jgi:hypothetical protein
MESMMNLIKTEYIHKFNDDVLKGLDTITQTVNDIITSYEYEYFSNLLQDMNIVLTQSQLNKLIANISYLVAFQFNFNESSQAKFTLINYINNLQGDDKKYAKNLISSILNSNECIHRQGSITRALFIKWWFKYLASYGYDYKTIATEFIPITYGKIPNKTRLIESKLLHNFNEHVNGYHITKCPVSTDPSWYYKMGGIDKWDGINLINYTFSPRLDKSPY